MKITSFSCVVFAILASAFLPLFSTAAEKGSIRFPAAEILVEPAGEAPEATPRRKFRVDDPKLTGELLSQFPEIAAQKGSGPRDAKMWKAAFVIKFHPAAGEPGEMRVACVSPDFTEWNWLDNPPYTGPRKVKSPKELQTLIRIITRK